MGADAPNPNLVQRFMKVFRGSNKSHGLLEPDGGMGKARTAEGAAGEAEFAAHLEGKTGLGICPATHEGIVYFGAIDVDNHDGEIVTDHLGICETVAKLGLPAIVCQTRRKGAHIYFFFPQGTPGVDVVDWLATIAPKFKKFGNPIEVFPKQKILTGTNKGNWLNLPYFDAEEGHRYAILDGQPLSLEEFLDWVDAHPATVPAKATTQKKSTVEDMDHSQAPPCIQRIISEGLTEGGRNSGMFALGTYLRIRKHDGDLMEAMSQMNRLYLRPPLASGQIADAVRRLIGGDYNYRCSDTPLCDMCDRATCITREFGVRAKAEVIDSSKSPIMFKSLVKVLTNPPTYKLKIGPEESPEDFVIPVETDELFTYAVIRKRAFDVTGVLLPKMKDSSWEKIMSALNDTRTEVPAPLDASPSAMIESALAEFCRSAERLAVDGTPRLGAPKDLLLGRPVALLDPDTQEARVYFRGQDFELFLRRRKINKTGRELWMILAETGCNYDEFKVDGTGIIAWSKVFVPFTISFDAPQPEERF